MSDLKTELLHKIMLLGADTYDKTHQDRYEAQIKADKLLEDYITERKKANDVTTSDGGLHLQCVSNSALHENQKLVENMCISYRHDFGLLMTAERNQIRRECEEWLRAYENNREHCC